MEIEGTEGTPEHTRHTPFLGSVVGWLSLDCLPLVTGERVSLGTLL